MLASDSAVARQKMYTDKKTSTIKCIFPHKKDHISQKYCLQEKKSVKQKKTRFLWNKKLVSHVKIVHAKPTTSTTEKKHKFLAIFDHVRVAIRF